MAEEKTNPGPTPDYCPITSGKTNGPHQMVSRSVPGAEYVRFVEICSLCEWIDPAALDGWAENAIKLANSKRAQRIAVATGTEPFAFVQSPFEELTLIEIMGQALGAASVCWVGGTGPLELDGGRAMDIGNALWQEFNRELRQRETDALALAADRLRATMKDHFSTGTIEDLAQTVLAATRIEAKTDPRSANAVANSDPGSRDRGES